MRPLTVVLVLPLIALAGCKSKSTSAQLGENGRIPVYPPVSTYNDEKDETTRSTRPIPLEREKAPATLTAFYVSKGTDLVKPESVEIAFNTPFPTLRPQACKWTTNHKVTITYDGQTFAADGTYSTQPILGEDTMMNEQVEVTMPLSVYKTMVNAKSIKCTVGPSSFELSGRQTRSLIQLANSTL